MEIEVKLFATFRAGRFNRKMMQFPDGARLRDLVQVVEIPEEEVSLPLVNGIYSDLGVSLKDGDLVSLFPAVGGG